MSGEENVVYSYSRSEALADGVLVDVTEQAKNAGVKHPTAVTAALWAIVSECPDATQSVEGRLTDTLFMFTTAARKQRGQEVRFTTLYKTDQGTKEVRMWAFCGPGDDGQPVLTLMLEGED